MNWLSKNASHDRTMFVRQNRSYHNEEFSIWQSDCHLSRAQDSCEAPRINFQLPVVSQQNLSIGANRMERSASGIANKTAIVSVKSHTSQLRRRNSTSPSGVFQRHVPVTTHPHHSNGAHLALEPKGNAPDFPLSRFPSIMVSFSAIACPLPLYRFNAAKRSRRRSNSLGSFTLFFSAIASFTLSASGSSSSFTCGAGPSSSLSLSPRTILRYPTP